jgi:predicted DsbA family dithiol-disulfide isomerase
MKSAGYSLMGDNGEQPLLIDYYSDVLCVWAWIAQPRLQEVCDRWGEQVAIRYRYLDIFGDAHRKICSQWGEENGFERFSEHIHEVAREHPHAAVHPDIWQYTRPRSSLNAHLFIQAARQVAGDTLAAEYALDIRRAFFVEALDVADAGRLLELAVATGVDAGGLQQSLASGDALAALSCDMREAQQQQVRGSPTWVLNAGRQVLYGNVGYRILHANIEELLRSGQGGASWC